MPKKSSISFQQEKRQTKKAKPISNIEGRLKNELEALARMKDKDLDFSDIPEIDFDSLGKPVIGKFYRPLKKPISIRIDADVLDWFKQHNHYQRLINKACRTYMRQHQK